MLKALFSAVEKRKREEGAEWSGGEKRRSNRLIEMRHNGHSQSRAARSAELLTDEQGLPSS
jgi:hypothetical protein